MKNRFAMIAVIAAMTLPQTAVAKWDPAYTSRDREVSALANRGSTFNPSAVATHSPVRPQMPLDLKPTHDPAYSSRDREIETRR